MLCGFSSLWWPFGWNWSYLGFLGIIWRTCGSKCRGEGGGIFPTLCAECCLVKYMWFQKSISNFKKWTFFETKYETMQQSHYSAVIRRAMAPQITGSSTVYSIVCSGADRRSHQSSALLTFVRGIHRWPVDSPQSCWKYSHMMTSSCHLPTTYLVTHWCGCLSVAYPANYQSNQQTVI